MIGRRVEEEVVKRSRSRERHRRSFTNRFLSFSLSLLSLTYRVVLDLLDVKKLLQARDLCLLHGRRRGGARVEEDLGRHSRVDRLVSRARERASSLWFCLIFSVFVLLFSGRRDGERNARLPLVLQSKREKYGEVEREGEENAERGAGNESELKNKKRENSCEEKPFRPFFL